MEIKNIDINTAIFKKKREENHLTVRQVEEKSGVGRSTISNIENGKNTPDGKSLLKMMFLYDLSKEEIALTN